MHRKITLEDVAKEAGVSLGAASKALNGYSSISEPTRRRVLNASQRLGYERRPWGRKWTVAQSQAHVGLALLGDNPHVPYMKHWTDSFTQAAVDNRFRLEMLHIPDQESPQWQEEFVRLTRGLAGVLVFDYLRKQLVPFIVNLPVPAVVVGNVQPSTQPSLNQVSVDTQGMGAFATRTLLEAGHRRIGFCSNTGVPGGWFYHWRAGYQLTMLESGHGLDQRLCPILTNRPTHELAIEMADLSLRLAEPPTAFIAPNAQLAWSLRHVMAERGVHLGPERMIIGADPGELGKHGMESYPSLSDNHDEGATQAMRLLAHLKRRHRSTTSVRVTVPFHSHNWEVFRKP